jgi:hypothetical protein
VSTSWRISIPRYVMAIFTMFILFGVLSTKKLFTIAATIASTALLVLFTVFFAMLLCAF